jgi:histidine triad (HIT) family protein
MANNCIFCEIANKEIPKELVYEDENIIAFNDMHPIAPIHVLIVPKKHIDSIADMGPDDEQIAGKMILAAKTIAEKLEIDKDGYKLLARVKKHGGQEINHAKLHLVGGVPLSEDIHPL